MCAAGRAWSEGAFFYHRRLRERTICIHGKSMAAPSHFASKISESGQFDVLFRVCENLTFLAVINYMKSIKSLSMSMLNIVSSTIFDSHLKPLEKCKPASAGLFARLVLAY